MRNIKELLQIVRDNLEDHLNSWSDGICLVLGDLLFHRIIEIEEYKLLIYFIKLTKPKPYAEYHSLCGYGWEPGLLKPRLDYLDEYLSKSLEELEEILK